MNVFLLMFGIVNKRKKLVALPPSAKGCLWCQDWAPASTFKPSLLSLQFLLDGGRSFHWAGRTRPFVLCRHRSWQSDEMKLKHIFQESWIRIMIVKICTTLRSREQYPRPLQLVHLQEAIATTRGRPSRRHRGAQGARKRSTRGTSEL